MPLVTQITGRRWIWITAVTSSVILVVFVLSLVDWELAQEVVISANRSLILFGVGLLALEGFLTAARFKLLATKNASYAQCLRASGWYVLLLLALPARLGEVAGVGTMVRYMGQRTGDSIVNLFLQRVFDVLTLGAMFCGVCVQSLSGAQLGFALAGAALIMTGLIVSVIYLAEIIAVFASLLVRFRQRKFARAILKVLLQARQSVKHHLDFVTTMKLIGLTVAKWSFILTAIACVVVAVTPALTIVTALGIGIAYNLAAVVPVQTIGGAGISEVVLLGSFKWLGYAASTGATLAIAIRLALLVGPILFGFAVLIYFELLNYDKRPIASDG